MGFVSRYWRFYNCSQDDRFFIKNRGFYSNSFNGTRDIPVSFCCCEVAPVNSIVRSQKMMKTIQITILLSFSILVSGCAKPYMIDRGRDVADIFSLAVGKGIGLKGRVGPSTFGLLMDYTALGLRGGELCREDLSQIPANYSSRRAIDCAMWPVSIERFELTDNNRGKNFSASSYVGDSPIPFFTKLDSGSNFSYYTDIEIVVAAYYSFRLGFNPGELVDFFLSWTTIDIYKDDISKINNIDHGNKGDGKKPSRLMSKVK